MDVPRDTPAGTTSISRQDANTTPAVVRQQVLLETHAARLRAEELLKQLVASQAECESYLKADERQDLVKAVAGQSSLESAIESTRRMIDALDRALEEARTAGETGSAGLGGAVAGAIAEVNVRAGGGVIGLNGARERWVG